MSSFYSMKKPKEVSKDNFLDTNNSVFKDLDSKENLHEVREKLQNLSNLITRDKKKIIEGNPEKIAKYSMDAFNLFSRIPNSFGTIFTTLRTPLVELILLNNTDLVSNINTTLKKAYKFTFNPKKKFQVSYLGMPNKKLIEILLDSISELNDKFQSDNYSKKFKIENLEKRLKEREEKIDELRIMYENKIDDITKLMQKKLVDSNNQVTLMNFKIKKMQDIVKKFNNTSFSEKKIAFKQLLDSLDGSEKLIMKLENKNFNLNKNINISISKMNDYKLEYELGLKEIEKLRNILADVEDENETLLKEIKKIKTHKEKIVNKNMIIFAESFGLMDKSVTVEFERMEQDKQVRFVLKRFKEYMKSVYHVLKERETLGLRFLEKKLKKFS